MTTLDELSERVNFYDQRIAELKKQIAECEARKTKLLSSIQVIRSELGAKLGGKSTQVKPEVTGVNNINKLDDRILAVLRHEALETKELEAEIDRLWPEDAPVNVSSIRTYLSGFRKAGVVDRIHKKWHLL